MGTPVVTAPLTEQRRATAPLSAFGRVSSRVGHAAPPRRRRRTSALVTTVNLDRNFEGKSEGIITTSGFSGFPPFWIVKLLNLVIFCCCRRRRVAAPGRSGARSRTGALRTGEPRRLHSVQVGTYSTQFNGTVRVFWIDTPPGTRRHRAARLKYARKRPRSSHFIWNSLLL